MFRLKELLTPVHEYLAADSPLSQAIQALHRTKWTTVPVLDDAKRLIGVFTRTSLYHALMDEKPLHTPIESLMKRNPVTIPLDISDEDLLQEVNRADIGTGIIVNPDGQVIGLLRKTDLIISLLRTADSLKGQLEEILATSELGALMTDESRKIIYVNRKFSEMTGSVKEELLHENVNVLISKLQIQLLEQHNHYRLKLGHFHTVARMSRYQTPAGNEGYIFLFQDISDVEKMAQELQTVLKYKSILQTVIDNAYDGLVMIDEFKRVTFISPSLLELFDLEEQAVLHHPVDEVLPQLELPRAIKTGISEFSDMMEIKGIRYTVQRIPVYQENERIGVIGKISFRGLNEMREAFRRFEKHERGERAEAAAHQETSRFTFDQIITQDPQMEKIIRSATKTARGNSTILIRGESGTGKELFAHAIHGMSSRRDGPFVTVNCAAIPEHLLESEFFGYEEGAFTGAKSKGKRGKFDLANGGTLFLDEVGDMSLQLQAKMLRVLQEKEFYRVGGMERIQVNVRIIAATNRSLEEMVENGEFREDLYYRLNVISLELPPLRMRKSDVMLLSYNFIQSLNRSIGTSITGMDAKVEEVMAEYNWPGNVRELRNVLERAMSFAETGKIMMEDLPDYLVNKVHKQGRDSIRQPELSLMERAEESAILQALKQAGGNKTKASVLLGISRSVLYEKLKKYQVKP